MPMTNAERQKRYIKRLKSQNPEKYEEIRMKHLERVKLYQRKVKDLTESEKAAQRERWRIANLKRKEKKTQPEIQQKEELSIRKQRAIKAVASQFYASSLLAENNKKPMNVKLQEQVPYGECSGEFEEDSRLKIRRITRNKRIQETDPLSVVAPRREDPETSVQVEDEDRLFLLSLLNPLKSVPKNKKMSVKIKIMSAIDEATQEDDVFIEHGIIKTDYNSDVDVEDK